MKAGPLKALRDFFRLEAAGGLLLMGAALLALAAKNSVLSGAYTAFLEAPLAVQLGSFFSINKPLVLWINDGLMALFFLLVGLELKRDVLEGHLSTREHVLLPALAALGGVVVPALMYVLITTGDPVALRGWAIPAATDIAFALGVMSLLGKRVPDSLKVCLVAIAVMDDLAAILIIAFFYTAHLSALSLLGAGGCLLALFLLNRARIMHLSPYLVVGVVLWACVLKSGIHATLAGVMVALFIPLRRPGGRTSPLALLEKGLHPWVAYGVLPLFAFANAGLSFKGLSWGMMADPVTLGVATGLFCGKQLGVASASALAVGLRICRLPEGVSWTQYYGLCVLTGIGFTMSLFIGGLAFGTEAQQDSVRLGVLVGSTLSAVAGYALLWSDARKSCAFPAKR